MKIRMLVCLMAVVLLSSTFVTIAQDDPAEATPGQEVNMILLPKFLGILPFEQTNQGAQEAHAELANPGELVYTGPTPENSVAGQIEIITNAVTQDMDAIMISNNSGDQIVPAAVAAQEAGLTVTTWDSPIPSGEGEVLFVAQVDFTQMGVTMADMALSILGEDGGQMAVLSANPDAANQNAWIASMVEALESDEKYANIELVDTVYGNDQSEESYNQALGLVDSYPDLELIMAPTSVGAPAAAKALQDEGLCDEVTVAGLAAPEEMLAYVDNGCAKEIAWWSFVDLGYLTYYITYMLATGDLEGVEGETFIAGRLGEYEIVADATREGALKVQLGDFVIYDIDNIHDAVAPEVEMEATAEATEAS